MTSRSKTGPALTRERRRIAIVLPDLRGGGVEKMRLVLAKEFLKRGFEVDLVLGRASGELLATVPAGVTLVDLNAPRLAAIFAPLKSYLRDRRPDAVLAAMWPLTVIAIAAVKTARVGSRIVVSDHNMLSRAYAGRSRLHALVLRASIALAYRWADERVVVSSGIASDLRGLCGIRESRFNLIHNPAWTPHDPSERSSADGVWGEETGARILAVGSLKPQKDHALLIEAFAEVVKHRPAKLVILGEGPLRPQLEAQIEALGLVGRVTLPGFITDVRPVYGSADLFVLSSAYEGFGNVIVEALACGVPVVSTDCPSGPADILEEGRYGELVPCGDAAALAQAMLRALGAEHDREALRRRAAVFTPENAAAAYLQLLFPRNSVAQANAPDHSQVHLTGAMDK